MAYVASAAFPVLPGKADRVRNFAQEVAPHKAEFDRLCRDAGAFRYFNVTLQPSPMGDLCIYSFVFDDPGKVRMRFSNSDYDKWWTDFVKDVHGIDLRAPDIPSPPPSVFTWEAAPATARAS